MLAEMNRRFIRFPPFAATARLDRNAGIVRSQQYDCAGRSGGRSLGSHRKNELGSLSTRGAPDLVNGANRPVLEVQIIAAQPMQDEPTASRHALRQRASRFANTF